ncbi:MAG: hypothetical protein ABIR35_11365 [Polaromonas sp.]
MVRIFSAMARFLPSLTRLTPVSGVARQLMENAEARAGRDPRQAEELRVAACAYLSVVR